MTADKEIIASEIKKLIPVENFRKPYVRDYDRIWIPSIAEDLIEALPEGHSIEVNEGVIEIRKAEVEREGFDKFLHDSTSTIFDQDNTPSFAELLEEQVNSTHWRKLLL